jgi:hypothetical protein
MAAISTRTAQVAVEYDFKTNGKIERRRKHFKEAHKARRFFCVKDEAGKNPKVLRGEEAKPPPAYVPLPREPRPRSLAEAFPPEPVNPGWQPTLKATGDPTKTMYDAEGNKPYGDGDQLTEEQIVAEAKKKVDAKKAAKQLRRKQKKAVELWRNKDTKTISKVVWVKTNSIYERWLVKFSDGTEEITQHLTVVHARDHQDHHLRIGSVGYIDGLTNKNYEEVLRRAADFARRAAARYTAGLANFRASEPVQKEMEKRISKKALKGDVPFEPTEIELAKKLAETANYYCTTPSVFFKAEEERLKSPHAMQFTNAVVDGILAKEGIDKLACTIRVIQYAIRLFNQMTPRLEIGGEQIGTPELAKEAERVKKEKAVTVTAKDGSTKTVTKKVSTPKEGPEVDAFGNRRKSGKGDINAEILKHAVGTVFTTAMIDAIDTKTIGTKSRTRRHFKKLAIKGFLEVTKKGYKLLAAGATGTPAKEPTAEPVAKAKAAANRKAKAKAAPKAKPAKKVAKKGTGKATAAPSKPAAKAKAKPKAKAKAKRR